MTPARVVGLDVGGSKTSAVLADASGVLAETVVGSANLASVGPAEATRQLRAALDRLGATGVDAVCAGAAGAGSAEQRDRLAALLGDLLPGAAVEVVHDARLLLAAAGDGTGIALISGTGSAAWGIAPDGRAHQAGGWGYLLGDEGSGYGIARAAVRHVLGGLDRAVAPDRLTGALVTACDLTGADDLRAHFYGNPERRYWAGRAGVVFTLAADGDPAAGRIVDEAAAALAALVRTVAGVLGSTGPVICAGGLITHQPMLVDGLRAELAGDVADVRLLDVEPVHGAVALARALSRPAISPAAAGG